MKTKEKTIIEIASLGGKARWKGIKKKDRTAEMKRIAKLPRKKLSTVLPTGSLHARNIGAKI